MQSTLMLCGCRWVGRPQGTDLKQWWQNNHVLQVPQSHSSAARTSPHQEAVSRLSSTAQPSPDVAAITQPTHRTPVGCSVRDRQLSCSKSTISALLATISAQSVVLSPTHCALIPACYSWTDLLCPSAQSFKRPQSSGPSVSC